MENKCLVNKLKGVVNNNNLPKLGEIRFSLAEFNTLQGISLDTTTEKTVKIVGNGHFYDVQNNDLGQTLEHHTNAIIYINNTGTNDILISQNKYDINNIYLRTKDIFPVGEELDVAYLTGLVTLNTYKSNNPFNIETVGKYSKNIETISSTNANPNVFGSIEKMVENLLNTGRNSGQMTINCILSQVTLHDARFFASWDDRTEVLTITFGTNSATCTWKSNTVASYNGATWTYSS